MPDRRGFLRLLLGTAAGASVARLPGAQTPPISVRQLADTLGLLSGEGGNSVVLSGPSGTLLVNSVPLGNGGAHPQDFGLGSKPIEFLFNTDWHPENTA